MFGTPLQIIVGLGNPGPEHQWTRHNAGFWFVDVLAQAHGQRFRSHAKYHGEVCRITLANRELTLLKPMTYMNRSGLAVRALAEYHKVPSQEILIVHDELDLAPGLVRMKFGGGHGGHNGLRDVIPHLSADFWRLRVGVGHPGDKSQVLDYLLRPVPMQEVNQLLESVQEATEFLPLFLEQGAEKAMNELHRKK